MAFRKKINNLSSQSELLIILEAEHPNKFLHSIPYEIIWKGANKNKGVGIYYKNRIKAKIHELYNPEFRYIIPIQIKAPLDVIIFVIWGMNNTEDVKRRYIGEVYLALKYYGSLLNNNCILAGDFNWNVRWDKNPSYPLYGTFTDVIELLEHYNIKSIYHSLNKEDFGKESMPTFFMYRKENHSFHTDYIFASQPLFKSIESFSIGSYAQWAEFSDHMPIFLDFRKD
jgi:exonuclease III